MNTKITAGGGRGRGGALGTGADSLAACGELTQEQAASSDSSCGPRSTHTGAGEKYEEEKRNCYELAINPHSPHPCITWGEVGVGRVVRNEGVRLRLGNMVGRCCFNFSL